MTMQRQDPAGEAGKYGGNTVWVACPDCRTWFPVSPRMQAPAAPPACCPQCHREFMVKESV
ncbi:MAG: hypothetical protein IT486_07550 [Gammaproteobacteria bacterium]|nr:hypothetical protein [Gammaproteobacteria bacterium]